MLEKLLALVGSITTWTRAGIVIVLGLAALLGTIVYQAQDRLIAAFEELVRTPPRAVMQMALADDVARTLLGVLPNAQAVVVWSVDLESNRRWLIGSATDDPAVAETLESQLGSKLRAGYPVLRAVPGANHLFIGALNGMVSCGTPQGTVWEAEQFAHLQIQTLCMTGVPPETGQLIGLLSATFASTLSPEVVEQVRPLFWQAAAVLAGHGRLLDLAPAS